MDTKPILFWPKLRSEIKARLDRGADDFSVVDTNCLYDLQKLYKIKRTTPIFDPFPDHGEHYRDFRDHVVGNDCSVHIVGMEACRKVSRALNDPSLARSSIKELIVAVTPAGGSKKATSRTLVQFSQFPMIKRSMKIPVDWSRLNWPNTILSAILVFVAALIGNVFFDSSLIAAIAATFVFAASYVCVRIDLPDLFFSMAGRPDTESQSATPGLRRL